MSRASITYLVHTCIGEEQRGVFIGNGRRGWYKGVLPVAEEFEEFLANSGRGPGASHSGVAIWGIRSKSECPR